MRVNNYYGKYSPRLLPCSDFWYAGIKGLCLFLCYLALSVNIIPNYMQTNFSYCIDQYFYTIF